jgi:Fe-S-cluster containining protein
LTSKEFFMTRQPLPLLDSARTEFGYVRTICACHECTLNCRHIPGYLIPADLERIHQHHAPNQDLDDWALQHLLASPGAIVLCRGQKARILTLVPGRRPDGACIFLTATGQCAIHAVAPYGCAFFDAHQVTAEADRRSKRGLQAIIEAWNTNGLYARLWMALAEAGFVSPGPEVARRELQQALTRSDSVGRETP